MTGGSIFLRDLLSNYPPEKLTILAYVKRKPSVNPVLWNGFKVIEQEHPREDLPRLWRTLFLYPLGMTALQFYAREVLSRQSITQVLSIRQREGSEAVWSILNSPFLIFLTRRLMEKIQTSWFATVWDPPESFILSMQIPPWIGQPMLSDFGKIISHVDNLSSASEIMEAEYAERYKRHSIVLIHGVAKKDHRPVVRKAHRSNEFRIGFAGNLYTEKEWRAFLQALDSINWHIGERRVILRVFAPVPPPVVEGCIEYFPWQDTLKVIKQLSECDLAYLPYWIDPKYRLITRLCFPNKISTYLAAGLPIFYHGPRDASPAKFMEAYPFGIMSDSFDPQEIARQLVHFVSNKRTYTTAGKAVKKAREKVLNLEVFQSRFREFLLLPSSGKIR
jgi:hypothetical protein